MFIVVNFLLCISNFVLSFLNGERCTRQNCYGEASLYAQKQLLRSKWNMVFRKRIIKCNLWMVALYSAETWTMTQADRERLAALKYGSREQ